MSEKFLFETSFEQAGGPNGQAKKAPSYGEADLAEARQEGFAAGKQDGERDAKEADEHHAAQSVARIAEQLPGLFQAQAEAADRQGLDAIEAAVTMVRKLFPKLSQRDGLREIESLVTDCLERLRDEPRVVIRVADSLLDAMKCYVAQIEAVASFDGKIVLLAEEELQPGDVRVEWADGGAERDSARLWREFDGIVEQVLGPPRPAAADGDPAPALDAATGAATKPDRQPNPGSTVDPAPTLPSADGAVANA